MRLYLMTNHTQMALKNSMNEKLVEDQYTVTIFPGEARTHPPLNTRRVPWPIINQLYSVLMYFARTLYLGLYFVDRKWKVHVYIANNFHLISKWCRKRNGKETFCLQKYSLVI